MNEQVYDTDPMQQAAQRIQNDYYHGVEIHSNYHQNLYRLYEQADLIPKDTLLGGLGITLRSYINWWSTQVNAVYDDYMALANGLKAGVDQAIATDTQIATQLNTLEPEEHQNPSGVR